MCEVENEKQKKKLRNFLCQLMRKNFIFEIFIMAKKYTRLHVMTYFINSTLFAKYSQFQ